MRHTLQVSQNLFVTLEHGVGDVGTTNAVLEYELNSWLQLQTNLIQAAVMMIEVLSAWPDRSYERPVSWR